MKEIIIMSSALIGALLLLRFVFAKKVCRAWIYAAWLLVALRLLIPIQIGRMPFSFLSYVQPMEQTLSDISGKQVAGVTQQDAYRQVLQGYIENDLSVFTPEVQSAIQNAVAEDLPKDEIVSMIDKVYSEADVFAPEVQSRVQQEVSETANPITLGQIMTIVWLIGVIAMVIWLAVGNLILAHDLRSTQVEVVCESPIPVYVSDAAVSPCLVGLFSPVIYLTPESAADEKVMGHVLVHELTHYAHKDHVWALIRCICLSVYWFNPLVWIAAWFSRRDCELACDEGALKRLGKDASTDYGKALLQVVSQSSASGRLMLTATTMAETKKMLKERLGFIVNRQRKSLIATVCLVLICVLVTGCVTVGPGDASEAPEKPSWEISEEEQAKLKQDYVDSRSWSHDCTAEDVDLVVISKVDSGYAAVIGCNCGGIDVNADWDNLFGAYAGDLHFYMPHGWFIQFCKDGVFRRIDEAYNLGWLTYPELRTVWDDYHAQFPKALEAWKQRNPGLDEPPARDPSGLDYVVNEDGKTCTVTGMGVCRDKDVVIPGYIDGYQVTAIGKDAFWAKKQITSVVLPDSVVSIGVMAFKHCDALKSVKLGTSLQSISTQAFAGCKELEYIDLPDSLIKIGGGAFSGCDGLTSVTIPDGVTVISSGMFAHCYELSSVSLSGEVTEIEGGAFGSCVSLGVIFFRGTMAQWENVNVVDPWQMGDFGWFVECNDGRVQEST